MQVQFDPGNDFFAVGTSKGVGVDNCPDRYGGAGSMWEIYTDGEKNGQYFCNEEQNNAYSAGNIPAFGLISTTCPNGTSGWNHNMGGTTRRCRSTASTGADFAGGMLETVPNTTTVDRNIDVRFRELEIRYGGVWSDFGVGFNAPSPPDANYSTFYGGTRRFDAYLAPLD